MALSVRHVWNSQVILAALPRYKDFAGIQHPEIFFVWEHFQQDHGSSRYRILQHAHDVETRTVTMRPSLGSQRRIPIHVVFVEKMSRYAGRQVRTLTCWIITEVHLTMTLYPCSPGRCFVFEKGV
jgi:hypothetical protein